MAKKDFVNEAVINFMMEADDKTIQDALSDYIPDMDAFEKKKDKLKRELDFLIKAQQQLKKNDLLLLVAKRFEEELLKNTEKPIAMLRQLIGSNQSFALNKGLDTLTKEEIIDIIKDKNLVELLDKLNNE